MAGLHNLNTDDVEVAQVPVVTHKVKTYHALTGADIREVNRHFLAIAAGDEYRCFGSAVGAQVIYHIVCTRRPAAHDIGRLRLVDALSKIDIRAGRG